MSNFKNIIQTNEVWFKSIYKDNYLQDFNYDEKLLNKINHFIEYGYLVLDKQFDDSITSDIINSELKYQGNLNEPLRALHAWNYNNNVKAIAINEETLKLLEILYQRKPIPFLTTNFKFGSQVPPHTDAIKYQTFPEGFMCAAWTALEDVDDQNGVIEIYPKSHLLHYVYIDKLNIIAKEATNRYAFYKDYEAYLKEFIKYHQLEKISIPIKKGQTIIWDANMIHAGSKIIDKNRTRYSQVTHYFFENCSYYAPLFSDIPLKNIYYWEVINILNNQKVKHYYAGKVINLKNTFLKKELNDLY